MMACLAATQAQYVVSDNYNLHFENTGHEVTTRKAVACTDNYQDLSRFMEWLLCKDILTYGLYLPKQ